MGIRKLKWLAILMAVPFSAMAGSTITINSGSQLLISGGKLELGCDDIEVIVNPGGTLRVTGGVVQDLNLSRKAGSTYEVTGGSVIECDGFYMIVTPEGKAAIFSL